MRAITRLSFYLLIAFSVLLPLRRAHAEEKGGVAVEVGGEVNHPGKYVLRSGARAKDAIAAAGGFTRLGDIRYTSVTRIVNGKKEVFSLHPSGAPQNRGVDFELLRGDSVYVFHEMY